MMSYMPKHKAVSRLHFTLTFLFPFLVSGEMHMIC